jgi:hypothetical protein
MEVLCSRFPSAKDPTYFSTLFIGLFEAGYFFRAKDHRNSFVRQNFTDGVSARNVVQ